MNTFRKLWWGKYSLPVAFWAFFFAGSFACFFVSGLILFANGFVDARPIGLMIGVVLIGLYWLVATVGVWRSAGSYWASPIWMNRIWAAAARIVVLLLAANILLRLVTGGAQVLMLKMTGGMDF